MNSNTISEELKAQAIGFGLCSEWTEDWGNPNLDDLVKKYIRGIDFAIEHDYPSNEYIIKNFGSVAEKHGVYTDSKFEAENPAIIVANGSTEGDIEYNGYVSRDIYARHNSKLKITVKSPARICVRVHDDAEVIIDCEKEAKAFVYQYGGKVFSTGNVMLRDRR